MVCCGKKPQILCISIIEFVTCLWVGCAIFTLVTSQQNFYVHGRYGKRHEPHSVSVFLTGSRYGRSGIMVEKTGRSVPKLVEIVPRMDRFFLGSRYGKRNPLWHHFPFSLNYVDSVLKHTEGVKQKTSVKIPDEQ